jgi:hypothetical protein
LCQSWGRRSAERPPGKPRWPGGANKSNNTIGGLKLKPIALAFVLAALVFNGTACKRPHPETAVKEQNASVIDRPDLSSVYRADKQLYAVLAGPTPIRPKLPELEKLTLALKTELSILQDRISYDQRFQSASMAALGLAVFFTFSAVAFASDLAEPRPSPYWWVFVYAADIPAAADQVRRTTAFGATCPNQRWLAKLNLLLSVAFLRTPNDVSGFYVRSDFHRFFLLPGIFLIVLD